MKNWSIRLKITLWFSVILVAIVALTIAGVLSVSITVVQKSIRDNLIETVENNVDEIEFYTTLDHVNLDYDKDYYLEYKGGYLEIDDDFLDRVNGISTALYEADGTFLFGDNPLLVETGTLAFSDEMIQKINVDRVTYYIFDRMLVGAQEGLWLRGIVSEQQGAEQTSSFTSLSMILLLVLVLLAVWGGYLIAGKSLRPIQQIGQAAAQINQGRDLKKRIALGVGNDEIHQLARTFDEMFERLDDSFVAQQQFIADASHELRTPMSVIMAQCEYSLEKPRDAEEYQNALVVVQRQGQKMSRLIEDMLDVTRIDQRSESYARESVDLSELTASVCRDMVLIQEQGIRLSYQVEEGIQITGNRQLLSRLLSNLITNAYRYGKENGHIEVCLKACEGRILLSVIDDGIGIPADQIELIFQRFYQVNAAHASKGTGLGLAMVRQIAHFHGGEITVSSQLGQGSTFVFILPQEKRAPS